VININPNEDYSFSFLADILSSTLQSKIPKCKKKLTVYQSLAGELLVIYQLMLKYKIKLDQIKILRESKGKPYLQNNPEIKLSISHTDHLTAVVFSKDNCGVDIELIDNVLPGVAKKIMTNNEYEQFISIQEPLLQKMYFYQIWTLKESYLKAIGQGFYLEPTKIEFSIKYVNNKLEIENLQDQKFSYYNKMLNNKIMLSITSKEIFSATDIQFYELRDLISKISEEMKKIRDSQF
jgi:4'-phosphopantetheinyl transferase